MAGSRGRIGRRVGEHVMLLLLFGNVSQLIDKIVGVGDDPAAGAIGEGLEASWIGDVDRYVGRVAGRR